MTRSSHRLLTTAAPCSCICGNGPKCNCSRHSVLLSTPETCRNVMEMPDAAIPKETAPRTAAPAISTVSLSRGSAVALSPEAACTITQRTADGCPAMPDVMPGGTAMATLASYCLQTSNAVFGTPLTAAMHDQPGTTGLYLLLMWQAFH
jgi:hypothetical protein